MQAHGLIDTGAILALLNGKDRWHDRCVTAFAALHLPLATTAAVLTELFHLLGEQPHDIEAAWRFVPSVAIVVLPITDSDMPDLDRLMKRYSDHPMDFADATLVRLAQPESLSTICTINYGDFETYRIVGRRKFRIVPPR